MRRVSPEIAAAIAAYVLSHWAYDPLSGYVFGRGGRRIGTRRKDGALQALVYLPETTTSVLLHRAAWLLMIGEWPVEEIDHDDRNRANNTWLNLRPATRGQNRQNLSSRTAKGGLRGATPRSNGKWVGQIKAPGGKVTYLGIFDTEEEAHAAYCKTKRELHDFNPEQKR